MEKIFLDFPDFFNIVKESVTNQKNEDIFYDLLEEVYSIADCSMQSPKDDVSDIIRKKKAFNEKIRKAATLESLGEISNSLSYSIIPKISKANELVSKLIFLINQDNVFFNEDDRILLIEKSTDVAYVIAYVLIRTISSCDKSKGMKHSPDYNPFAYYSYVPNFTPKSSFTKTMTDLQCTSKYIYDTYIRTPLFSNTFRSELLSNGFSYDVYRTPYISSTSFAITASSGESETKPLNAFLSDPEHLLIIGEGGIGKTTFLYSYLKHYHEENHSSSIPIYIRLADCSTNTDHKHMILNSIMNSIGYAINGSPSESYKDILDEFEKMPEIENFRKYTLLLDGFNEVTAMDYGEVRSSMADEISSFTKMNNVRIILTSREIDFYSLSLSDFKLIRANGISKQDVLHFLSSNLHQNTVTEINYNQNLLYYLQIPLFLIMYTNSVAINSNTPQNRGGILFSYFNSPNSFYNEKVNIQKKANKKTALLANAILDFILPDIGFYMEESESFRISDYTFEEQVTKAIVNAEKFTSVRTDLYKTYYQAPTTIKSTLHLMKNLDTNDVLVILRDCLGIVSSDSDGKIYFCHQYIRDYFAAYYCIREIHFVNLVVSISQNLITADCFKWGISRWENGRLSLIHEILSCPSVFKDSNLIYTCIESIKAGSYDKYLSQNTVLNLIEVLSMKAENDLSAYNFDNLNLTWCNLSNLNFHNKLTGNNSSFTNSTISLDTFATEEHAHSLLKWALSDDERFIISVDHSLEIKVWNLATQHCIFTRNLNLNTKVSSIEHLSLRKKGTIAVITFRNQMANIAYATTYNITADTFTCYKLEVASSHFLFFDFDEEEKQLVAISSSGYMHYYDIDNPIAIKNNLSIAEPFRARLAAQYIDPYVINHRIDYPLKKLYVLRGNKILYIESDVLSPYVHTIHNEYMSGEDWNLKPVADVSELYELKEPTQYDSRHINFFIYDLEDKDVYALQLDCTPDEVTSLVMYAHYDEDIISNYIAISKDRRYVALQNKNNQLFIYDTQSNDYYFKTICELPYHRDYHLKFCHHDTNILTLFDEHFVIHLDITTHEIKHEISIGTNSFSFSFDCTDVFRIVEYNFKGSGAFRLTNIYTSLDTSLCLTSKGMVLVSELSKDLSTLYVLYENGTLYTLDSTTMELLDCYNYSSRCHVIAHSYDKKSELLCYVSSPYHAFMYSHENSIILVDLSTGKKKSSRAIFGTINKILISGNGKYIIAVAENEIIILKADTMTTCDQNSPFGYDYERPIDIYTHDDDVFHILYSKNFHYDGIHYFGTLITYKIDCDHSLIKQKITYIPLLTLDDKQLDPLLVKQSGESSICLLKSFPDKISKNEITYLVQDCLEKESTYKTVSLSLNKWNLAYIEVNGFDEGMKYLPLRSDDISIKTNYHDNIFIGFKNSKTYEYSIDDNIYNEFTVSESYRILCYNKKTHSVYLTDNDNNKIYLLDIKTNSSPIASSYLHPNILLMGCTFSNCCGDLSLIPHYLITQ